MNVLSAEHVQLQALSDGVQELNRTLETAGAPPAVLVNKGGELCTVSDQGELIKLSQHSLAVILRAAVEPGRPKENKEGDPLWIPQPGIPRDMIRSYIDRGVYSGVPRVRQVAKAPVLRPDFTVRWEAGWDEATHCWVTEGHKKNTTLVDFKFDIRRIFSLFPFTDENMVADCIAAALTPLLSTAIEGALPAFLVTARKPGSGKSELAKFCSMTGNGGKEFTTWRRSEEMQKLIASFAMEDKRTVIFDNIKTRIDNADLESAITSRKLTFRAMATHTSKHTPCNTTWFFTSNGVSMSQDLLRRSIVVLLDKDANPKEWNEDGKGSALVRFVDEYEEALVSLLLSLVENWRVAGCPDGSLLFSGFEEWSRTVSGILEANAVEGLWEARDEVLPNAVQTDEDDEIAVVEAIAEVMGVGSWFSAKELWGRVHDDMEFFGSPAESSQRFLKEWFKQTTGGKKYDGESGGGIGMGRALADYKEKSYEGCPYKLTFKKTSLANGYEIEKIIGPVGGGRVAPDMDYMNGSA